MCGRFSLTVDIDKFIKSLGYSIIPELSSPREYNISPSMPVLGLVADPNIRVEIMQWGFVPSWAKPEQDFKPMINARGETLAEKPFFRTAFKSSRCIILSNGYYEWQNTSSGKIPFRITTNNDSIFAMAGLWASPKMLDGTENICCTIITTEANNSLKHIHNRMPVILEDNDISHWLDPRANEKELLSLIKPTDNAKMRFYEVSRAVSNPANNSSICIEPVNLF